MIEFGIPTSGPELFELFLDFLPRLISGLVALLVGFFVIKITVYIFQKVLTTAKVSATLIDFLKSISSALLWFLLAVLILHRLGLSSVATAISSVVALFSFGIGLGAQGMIADILAGTFLATEKKFRVGARVIAGSKQTEGVIEMMDFRKVRIRDDKGRLHVLPNADVERTEWTILDGDKKR